MSSYIEAHSRQIAGATAAAVILSGSAVGLNAAPSDAPSQTELNDIATNDIFPNSKFDTNRSVRPIQVARSQDVVIEPLPVQSSGLLSVAPLFPKLAWGPGDAPNNCGASGPLQIMTIAGGRQPFKEVSTWGFPGNTPSHDVCVGSPRLENGSTVFNLRSGKQRDRSCGLSLVCVEDSSFQRFCTPVETGNCLTVRPKTSIVRLGEETSYEVFGTGEYTIQLFSDEVVGTGEETDDSLVVKIKPQPTWTPLQPKAEMSPNSPFFSQVADFGVWSVRDGSGAVGYGIYQLADNTRCPVRTSLPFISMNRNSSK